MMNFLTEAEDLFDYTSDLRRDFHRHPELGFNEYRTAEIIANELKKSGLTKIKTGIAKTGIVGLVESEKPGPVVLVRFDMDALPIIEENEKDYSSRIKGVMHACGHDGHTAVGLTAAKLLALHKDELAGTVKFVFQPAEEGLGGAKEMVNEGILDNPRPDYSLAIHVWNDHKLDWFGITPGPIMAAADAFKITLTGKGGHGAAPHHTNDPIFAAAQIITGLQSIVSRNIHPLESAVVSIGSIQGGSAFNIIPTEVELLGTIRTFHPEVREIVLNRFKEIVIGISSSLGCSANIEILPVTHAVSNDGKLTQLVQEVAERLFPNGIVDRNFATMGSEDFSFMMQNIPGCFIFVGSSNPDKGLDAKHHHPRFDFDETALVYATALLTTVVSDILTN